MRFLQSIFLLFLSLISLQGLELKRVIIASDDNPLYLEFWPVVAATWKAMGFQPTLALIAEEGCVVDTTLGDVIRFSPVPGISKAMQAQVYRLFLPCLFPEDGCLISDMDMIPISKSYFVDGAYACPDEAFLVYRDAALPPPQYPMCYVAGKGKVFSSIFKVTDPQQFPDRIREWKAFIDAWSTDQVMLYHSVIQWELLEGGEVVRLGHGVGPRLDRPEWNNAFSLTEIENAIDCHCPRPYSLYKNSIDHVVNEVLKKYQIEKEKKVLMLVISSRTAPVYEKLEEIWRSYIHSDPEHLEAYFLRSDPDLPVPYEIRGDVFWAKVTDTYWPGIVHKTLRAMEAMLPRIKEFDYVIRTNLSSFFVLPRLFRYLKTLPKTGCYSGVVGYLEGYGHYVSGTALILSPDLMELLVKEQAQIPHQTTFWDDVIIGNFFYNHGVPIIPGPRMNIATKDEWLQVKDTLLENSNDFHFRLKNHDESIRAIDEAYVHSEIAKLFYNCGYSL